MERRQSLRLADRNRLAKYRFFSENSTNDNNNNNRSIDIIGPKSTFQRNTPIRRSLPIMSKTDSSCELPPAIDISIPGTPISARLVMALKNREKQNAELINIMKSNLDSVSSSTSSVSSNKSDIKKINSNTSNIDQTIRKSSPSASSPLTDNVFVDESPFKVFVDSMDKLQNENVNENKKSQNLLENFIKKSESEHVSTTVAIEPSSPRTTPLKSNETCDETSPKLNKSNFGYDKVGVYNSGTNLKLYPSIKRSFYRRFSQDNNLTASTKDDDIDDEYNRFLSSSLSATETSKSPIIRTSLTPSTTPKWSERVNGSIYASKMISVNGKRTDYEEKSSANSKKIVQSNFVQKSIIAGNTNRPFIKRSVSNSDKFEEIRRRFENKSAS